MATWQDVHTSTLYGTADEWRELYDEYARTDRLRFWEAAVSQARGSARSPRGVRSLAQMFEVAEQTPTPATVEDLDRFATVYREAYRERFQSPDRRDWRWVSWAVFAVGLLLVSIAVGQVLLAVTDAR